VSALKQLEVGLAEIEDFDEAVAWLDQNPKIAEELTQASLLEDFWSIQNASSIHLEPPSEKNHCWLLERYRK
jgi:hypothetical protein